MIQITATVENHILESQFAGLARDGGAYQFALFYFVGFLRRDILIPGRSGSQGLAVQIVDQLHIDLAIAPEYRQSRLLSRSADLFADAELDLLSPDYFSVHCYLFFRATRVAFHFNYLPAALPAFLRTTSPT